MAARANDAGQAAAESCKRRPLNFTHDSPALPISKARIITTLNRFYYATMIENAMDESTLKQYLADDPPTVVPLAIKPHFEALNDKEKKYAHYISRAAFAGTRINLRYVVNHFA